MLKFIALRIVKLAYPTVTEKGGRHSAAAGNRYS